MKKQKKVEKKYFFGSKLQRKSTGYRKSTFESKNLDMFKNFGKNSQKIPFFLNDAPPYTMARMSSPHLKCCINVGFREAPCKKSFGILASYWTPPKIK